MIYFKAESASVIRRYEGEGFMADKIERSSPAVAHRKKLRKRRDERYDVSGASRQHIKLKVKSGNEFVPAILGNFSRNAFSSSVP